jgi:hypothetical protein
METIEQELINETKLALKRFLEDTTINSLRELSNNPYEVMKKAGVSAVNFIDSSKIGQWSRKIKRLVSKVIRKFGKGFRKFNSCFICKAALITLFYVLITKLNTSIIDITDYKNEIADLLKKFFEESIERIRNFIESNDYLFAKLLGIYQLDDFIERLCEEFGMC